jgi:hypothetical protein
MKGDAHTVGRQGQPERMENQHEAHLRSFCLKYGPKPRCGQGREWAKPITLPGW